VTTPAPTPAASRRRQAGAEGGAGARETGPWWEFGVETVPWLRRAAALDEEAAAEATHIDGVGEQAMPCMDVSVRV